VLITPSGVAKRSEQENRKLRDLAEQEKRAGDDGRKMLKNEIYLHFSEIVPKFAVD